MWSSRTLFLVIVGLATSLPADELRVYPKKIKLSSKHARQSLVVQLIQSSSRTVDVTDQVKWSIDRSGVLRRTGNSFSASSTGSCVVRATYGKHVVTVAAQVAHTDRIRRVSFKLDVMPVLMKAGCNSGTCHGFSRGQNGFRLSVFGFDPEGDHYRLTRQFIGRRVNLAEPKESLVLTKPSGQVAHGGGQRFEPDSELHKTLLQWVDEGAKLQESNPVVPIKLEAFPSSVVLPTNGRKHRLVVNATYSDGSVRDVTHLTVLTSSNSTTAKVTNETIVAGKRGESFVMARFATFTVGIEVIVVPANQPFTWKRSRQHNYIDKLVDEKLQRLRVNPSRLCDDETFLRRVYIDLVGLLPTVADYKRFLADRRADRRKRLIDELLKRPEFTDIWVMKWAELLQIRRIKGGFFNWLKQRLESNVPMDRLVREILTAEGGFFRDPPVQYFEEVGDPPKLAENFAQVFMGTRIQCARCHNHPFDRWTMDDYFGFTAFFAQLGYKRAPEDSREKVVYNRGSGEVRHPITQKKMPPRFLGGSLAQPKTGQDRRAVLAHWLTRKDNPWFARNLANLAWAHLFGRGIVDPVDDVRVSNPPSNVRLLQMLAAKMVEYKYDFRKLMRDICRSRTYQGSLASPGSTHSQPSSFSHRTLRRLRSEVLHDCLCQATNRPSRLGGFPLGTRAVQLPVASMSTYFLKTFGRSGRATVCSCEVDVQPNLSQSLHLINGQTIWGKIRGGAVIDGHLQAGLRDQEIIDRLFIRCLTRKPTAKERRALLTVLATAKDKKECLEDLFWALLNSKEFLFNR